MQKPAVAVTTETAAQRHPHRRLSQTCAEPENQDKTRPITHLLNNDPYCLRNAHIMRTIEKSKNNPEVGIMAALHRDGGASAPLGYGHAAPS